MLESLKIKRKNTIINMAERRPKDGEKFDLTVREKTLMNRQKFVDTQDKIEIIKQRRLTSTQDAQKRDLEIEALQYENELLRKDDSDKIRGIFQLLVCAESTIIDSDKTIMASEPVMKSLWSDSELKQIKANLLTKLKAL